MSLPAYVVNFDELVNQIAVEGVDIEIDTTNIEKILKKYFPEIVALLKKISNAKDLDGTQKVKGLMSKGEAVIFIPESDILLTGVVFSQTLFDGSCLDKWNLKISYDEEEIILLDGIYGKDALQHKYFERFYPVPAGYEIIIEPINEDGQDKTYWFDLEYLDNLQDYNIAGPGEIIVSHPFDYKLVIRWDNVHRIGAAWIDNDYDRILLDNYSDGDHFGTDKDGVWVDSSEGMDGKQYLGEAVYTIIGMPDTSVYFGLQRCPYCDVSAYIEIELTDNSGNTVHLITMNSKQAKKLIKALTIKEPWKDYPPSQVYTPIFKFDFTGDTVEISNIWS